MAVLTYDFDKETELTSIGENRWATTVHSNWNIATFPNGGYLMSLVAKAMLADSKKEDPLSLSVHYLRPGQPDQPGEIETELVRKGRTISVVRGRLVQNGKARVEALGSFSNVDLEAMPLAKTIKPEVELPAPQDCDGDFDPGMARRILERVELRLNPDQTLAGSSSDARVDGWIRFRDGRPIDTLALLLFADVMPPPIYASEGQLGWVPTIELSVHVRRRPVPGWIRAQFSTRDVHGNRLIEDGILWDESGEIVAQSRQVAMIL